MTQVDPGHYQGGYDTPSRFASYWYQVEEAVRAGGRTALEIGIGNGTVTAILRRRGLDVTTCDFDAELEPDVVADVRRLPFDDCSFDTVVACEVLEHIPWPDVPRALGEIGRVARAAVVLSVPDQTPRLNVVAELPNALHVLRLVAGRRISVPLAMWALTTPAARKRGGGTFRVSAEFARLRSRSHAFDGEHYWELGAPPSTADALTVLCAEAGLRVTCSFRPPENSYHRFVIAERL